MSSNGESKRTITSLEIGFNIVETLQKLDGATASELSSHIDRSAGTLHTYLSTLHECGYLRKDGYTYHLGTQFIVLGEYVRNHSPLYQAGKRQVDEVAAKTGESTHLIVEENGLEKSLYENFGDEAVGEELFIKNRENPQRHLHGTASGKSILANLPEDRVREIINANGLVEKTPNTITDFEKFLQALEDIRDKGFALNDEEEMEGIRAVGAPIIDEQGEVLGAISLSAPTTYLSGETFYEEMPETLMRAANVIEVNIRTEDFGIV